MRAGLTFASTSLHAPSADSIAQAAGQDVWPGTATWGARSGLSTFVRPSTLAARRMTQDPVRASRLFRRSTSSPREASRLSLGPASRCLDSVSTTDVSCHEHPSRHHLWRPGAGAVGKPADVTFADRPRKGCFHLASDDAGPPFGHPASSSRALDGAPQASGRSTGTFARTRGAKRGAAFSASDRSVESSPLTPLVRDARERNAGASASCDP